MNQQAKSIYEFGSFRLDAAEHQLLRAGEPVPLTPKVYDLLLVLVESSGQLLSKDELMQRVWPDTIVEENNLTVNMSGLRKALGAGEFIQTLPRRGYRFVAEVRIIEAEPELIVERHTATEITVTETVAAPRRLRPSIFALAALALAVLAAAGYYFYDLC